VNKYLVALQDELRRHNDWHIPVSPGSDQFAEPVCREE
jgi:hypothetical protein